MKKRVLILFLVVLLLVIGVFAYNKFKPLPKKTDLSQPSTSPFPSPIVGNKPVLKKEEFYQEFYKNAPKQESKLLSDLIASGSATLTPDYLSLVNKIARSAETIELTDCRANPILTKVTNQKSIKFKNTTEVTKIKIFGQEYQLRGNSQEEISLNQKTGQITFFSCSKFGYVGAIYNP